MATDPFGLAGWVEVAMGDGCWYECGKRDLRVAAVLDLGLRSVFRVLSISFVFSFLAFLLPGKAPLSTGVDRRDSAEYEIAAQ